MYRTCRCIGHKLTTIVDRSVGASTSAVEDLSDGGGGQDAVATQEVGDVATNRHDDRHDEMRQGGQRPALLHRHVATILHCSTTIQVPGLTTP